MKFTSIVVALAAAFPAISEALIFNKTQAYATGNLEKYRCLDTLHWVKKLPTCLKQCQIDANLGDGCAYDDFACHCANYDSYSPIIEKCAFPPQLGGTGSCSLQELGGVRPLVNDMCNFFNATGYTAYTDCYTRLSPKKTFAVIQKQTITILDE
ncbi:hypothetical protein B0A48_03082 [Cryoendolithus antarcticus]|uniref:CFEM domain-containing protein n=1 Tax=Cryoendolithus antarcticus TaxID=1507870 RepID=A0A1V8TM41_9PEZI|nr:hypothetical protein B0A48_03082 [Cryoendolithus antarcticus]